MARDFNIFEEQSEKMGNCLGHPTGGMEPIFSPEDEDPNSEGTHYKFQVPLKLNQTQLSWVILNLSSKRDWYGRARRR